MRPVHIRLAGFTAFRDEQQIDFGDLELFAITGPTGSGKSSILDAMTYVLFGKVERVGDRVSQLISQGQPAMSVELTFSIDEAQFRVFRRTSTTAPTRILLQRDVNGEWEQYGPGADRVRDVEAALKTLLGLDYDAFTRSILLPQGKFQQFLTGDAAERRRILSDLLGLDIYGRMAGVAGELAAQARGQAEARRETLAAEYADVSAEELAHSRQLAASAVSQELRVAAISAEVERIAEQARADEQRTGVLTTLEGDVRGVARRAAEAVPRINVLGQSIDLAQTAVTAAGERATQASEAVAAARRDLAAAETAHGRNTELAAQLALLSERRALGEQLEQLTAERDGLQAAAPAAAEAEQAAAAAAERAAAGESAARRALAESVAAREHMAQRHAVAVLLVGAEAGGPCPVCGEAMAALPDAPGGAEVAEADAAHRSALQAVAAAEEATRRTAEALTTQRALVAAQARRQTEMAAAIAELRERVEVRDEQLAPVVGAGDLDAAAQTIQTRLAALTDLSAAISEAEATARECDVALAAERDTAGRLRGELQTEQVRLREMATSELSTRVADAVPGTTQPAWPALAEQLDAPDELGSAAAAIVTGCDRLRAVVLADLAEVAQRAAAYREQAFTAAADYAGDATDLATLRRELASAHRAATAKVATTGAATAAMAERLERRASMEVEARAAEQRAALMRTLAQALRSDRLVAFVQAEALEALASSATRHLAELSDGRYRLACRANDFEVIDTWNGEERRSVRTLSGGETFLASLALALALAEQVPAIGMAQRVRLDSLFLDEGFGTLDPESLDTVIAAINVLGADGRMVGVVSHVAELAESLPMRLEVSKSPRGSRISRVDTAVPSA